MKLTNNVNGAPATTRASWRQSKYAPTAKLTNTPICPNIFKTALRQPLMSVTAISLM